MRDAVVHETITLRHFSKYSLHSRFPWDNMFPRDADMAQLVEHHLAKVGVAGSNPVVRSRMLEGRS